MPITPTHRGLYIEELPSGIHTITGGPTSVTAFVGVAARGPVNAPIVINNFADYERQFGALSAESLMSYSVFQYYRNGGSMAVIVRLKGKGARPATLDLGKGLKLEAKYPGEYGKNLLARTDQIDIKDADKTDAYNLTLCDMSTGEKERYASISIGKDARRRLDNVLKSSQLVTPTKGCKLGTLPEMSEPITDGSNPFIAPNDAPALAASSAAKRFIKGTGNALNGTFDDKSYGTAKAKTGLYALLKADVFNLLVLPQLSTAADISGNILNKALALCVERRAMLIVDPPKDWDTVKKATDGAKAADWIGGKKLARNAALYFPRIKALDRDGRIQEYAPAGAVAGVFARTDRQRGVWKAPAGTDATLNGVVDFSLLLTDPENGQLNSLGVNCLRSFPIIGRIVWGARTLRGADLLNDQWKYVSVRRLALFIEESLYRGTKWVVFEPNDEPLWSQISLNVGVFMNALFRQGAFQGRTPREAYFVKCDRESMTQDEITRGIVNIIVGFAPLKPAEFVIVKIQQLAGQVET